MQDYTKYQNYESLKIPHQVPFGKVDGQDRGDAHKLFKPTKYINDDYYWIRSDNRDNQKVLDLLNHENELTMQTMQDTQGVREQLYKEMKSRILDDDSEYPHRHFNTPYLFYKKYISGKGQPLYCRSKLDGSDEQVILDVNKLAEGKKNCDVTTVMMNFDGTVLSYAVDYNGNELYDVYFKNLVTVEMLTDKLT